MKTLLCILAASLAGPAWAQGEARFALRELETLEFSPAQPGEAALQLHAVYFSGGGWQPETVVEAFRQSVAILAQCGVRLTQVQQVQVDAPRKYQFYRTPVSREFARIAAFARPTVYFVRDTLNRPAFDAEAIGLANSRTRPELANSVWVTLGAHDLGIALAHELTHMLMDSGEHSVAPGNLMRAETAPGNTALDAAQCERLRRTGEKNGLLK